MDDLTVRPAETGDAADVRRIARESWHAAYNDIVGSESVESVVDEWYDLDQLCRSVERDDGVFLVAEDESDSQIIGFAQGVLAEDEAAELPRIYVHPDYWGEGAGSAMLERVEDWLTDRGAERLRLVVLADNEVGNGFYEKHGYRKVGSPSSRARPTPITSAKRNSDQVSTFRNRTSTRRPPDSASLARTDQP